MEKNFIVSECCFGLVADNHRKEIINWLLGRYHNLTKQDGEDIVQQGLWEVYKKVAEKTSMLENEVVKLWKVISRNIYTHWVSKQRFNDDWDDSRLMYDWEERDYCWEEGNEELRIKREMLYDYLEGLKEDERTLIEMVLAHKSMKEISVALGYRSTQVAKNKKSKIMAKMKEELCKRAQSEGLLLYAA